MNNMLETLENLIVEWGEQKGILWGSDPKSQLLKTVEEVGELASAIGKEDHEEIKDAIGDIIVTLILQSRLQGFTLTDCVSHAYGVISQRTGEMQNGVFVKDE